MANPTPTETKITIKDLELNLSVGLLTHEKNAPQRILISMDLYLKPDYLQTVDEKTIVDYGAICDQLKQWETAPHTDLIETLIQNATTIAFSHNAVTATRIHIRKPDIINQAQAVGVEVFVER